MKGKHLFQKLLSVLKSPWAVLGDASGGGLLQGPRQLPSSHLQPEDHARHLKEYKHRMWSTMLGLMWDLENLGTDVSV